MDVLVLVPFSPFVPLWMNNKQELLVYSTWSYILLSFLKPE